MVKTQNTGLFVTASTSARRETCGEHDQCHDDHRSRSIYRTVLYPPPSHEIILRLVSVNQCNPKRDHVRRPDLGRIDS